jgi:O-antigen ligase
LEFISIVGILIALVLVYFFLGMVLKFLWGWMPFVAGLLVVLALALGGGWLAAGLGVVILVAVLTLTNSWHSTALYQKGEALIDKTFSLGE